MKRLLFFVFVLAVFGPSLTACTIYPYPLGATVTIGHPQGQYDNRNYGHRKIRGRHDDDDDDD